jgi:hypothetical protein
MKKFSVALLALATAIAITPSALAGSLCPNTAGTGGDGTGTFTAGSGCAETMSIPNSQNYARLAWAPGNSGYPANLTLGNLGGITASVALTSSTDQPYYMLAFQAPNVSLGQTASTDQILMLEFQDSTLSGSGNDTLALAPNTTLFNLYDNTDGQYLLNGSENPQGQQNAQTLDYWLGLYPGLSSDDIQQIRLAIGMSGGSGPAESVTVNSADVTETPEPSSLLLLGTGLLGLAGMLRRKLHA